VTPDQTRLDMFVWTRLQPGSYIPTNT